MSFTTEIKNEICSNDYSKLENICLLSGYIRNNASLEDNKIVILSENLKVVRKIYTLFKELYDVTLAYEQTRGSNLSKKSIYNIYIEEKLDIIEKSLMLNIDIPDYFLDGDDLKRAYLRGAFLAKGSINDPKKSRYHLEFLVDSSYEADFIMELLNYFDLHAKVIPRDRGYMTYVKEAEKIGDFLRIVSANNAILYYEDIRIYRDHKNMTNRLNNMEQANVDKSINASREQLEDIKLIKEKIGLDAIDDRLRDVIVYREKYPEVSLAELSEIISSELDKKITKSGLSHRLRKIREIANRLRKKD
ncbi:MAG: DNA-binding protein WhiA [Bacilli bacterium]|nr:DNA-binding protein WhiA [Bacilli bacterium]